MHRSRATAVLGSADLVRSLGSHSGKRAHCISFPVKTAQSVSPGGVVCAPADATAVVAVAVAAVVDAAAAVDDVEVVAAGAVAVAVAVLLREEHRKL